MNESGRAQWKSCGDIYKLKMPDLEHTPSGQLGKR